MGATWFCLVMPHVACAHVLGEDILLALIAWHLAATADCLKLRRASDVALAHRLFIDEHRTVFKDLHAMQNANYRSDNRCGYFVSLHSDIELPRLTSEAFISKKLVGERPMAHLKIGLKKLAHVSGLVSPTRI